MRLPKTSSTLFFFVAFTLMVANFALAQDSEDSTAPKRVLKKYRVRRPVIVDDQGNVVRAGPRLRRVRVKNPRPETSTQTTVSVVTSSSATESLAPTSAQPTPVVLRQGRIKTTASPISNAISASERPQQVVRTPRPSPQTVYFEEQGIIEPVRTIPTYRQATPQANRDALLANTHYKPSRGTSNAYDEEKKVGTVTNYSKINDDGSFTFGYEAEDGSFKEETRGVDCVVRGKYGYIDPEGVRREFEYVSGNPCDPNDPNKDEEQSDDDEEDALAPSRPLLRQRVRPNSDLSDNNIQQGQQQVLEERLPEDQLANFVRPAIRQRVRISQNGLDRTVVRQRVRITTPPPPVHASTTASSLFGDDSPFRPRFNSLSSPRPSIFSEVSQSLDDSRPFGGRGLFSFDDEVHRLARPQNQPQPLYEQPFRQVVHQPPPSGRQVFGNAAFRQEQNQIHAQQQQQQQQPTGASPTPTSSGITNSNFGRYRTELVYDPASGQYTSVLVQANANTNQEFELTQKLRAFVEPSPSPSPSPSPRPTPTASPSFPTTPSSYPSPSPPGAAAYTQIQQFGQPQIQYYHHPSPQPQQQAPIHQARSANPTPQPSQNQDPSQINQFLARHAYQVQAQSQSQAQSQTLSNVQFIPPHLRPGPHQTAEIERQQVREINFPPTAATRQGFSANSAAASNGQIDAFLRALNISI